MYEWEMESANRTLPENLMDRKNRMDGLVLMSLIPDAAAKAAFFDPQYRGVLDKLSYGNEGKGRGKGRCALPQMGGDLIREFIAEIGRCLAPSGHLFLWLDKFHLVEGAKDWLCEGISPVDLIVWDKERIGMGYRSRRRSEYLLVIQKIPLRAKGCWKDHAIPDVWAERKPKSPHPHAKPDGLLERLVLAVTEKGDLIIDPAAGSWRLLDICRRTGRKLLGADLNG